jgi:hypothetical protein
MTLTPFIFNVTQEGKRTVGADAVGLPRRADHGHAAASRGAIQLDIEILTGVVKYGSVGCAAGTGRAALRPTIALGVEFRGLGAENAIRTDRVGVQIVRTNAQEVPAVDAFHLSCLSERRTADER